MSESLLVPSLFSFPMCIMREDSGLSQGWVTNGQVRLELYFVRFGYGQSIFFIIVFEIVGSFSFVISNGEIVKLRSTKEDMD